MKGAIMLSGGGSGKLFAAIGVTYPVGSTLTCANGTKTLTAKTTSGQWVFAIPEAGTWTVAATDGTDTSTETVVITAEGQSVSVELSYGYYIFKSGVGFQNGYSVEFAKYQTIGTPTYDAQKIDFSAADIVNTGSAFIITPGINLSAYTTLFMDVDITATYSGNKYDINYGVGSYEANGNFGPSAAGNVMGTWAAIGTKAVQGNASRTTLELDISNVNSAQNIKFEAYAMTGYVYNIWLV